MKKESELAHDWDGTEIHEVRALRRAIHEALETKSTLSVVRAISDLMDRANDGKPDDGAYEIAMLSLRFVRIMYQYNTIHKTRAKAELIPKIKRRAQDVYDKIDEVGVLDEEEKWHEKPRAI